MCTLIGTRTKRSSYKKTPSQSFWKYQCGFSTRGCSGIIIDFDGCIIWTWTQIHSSHVIGCFTRFTKFQQHRCSQTQSSTNSACYLSGKAGVTLDTRPSESSKPEMEVNPCRVFWRPECAPENHCRFLPSRAELSSIKRSFCIVFTKKGHLLFPFCFLASWPVLPQSLLRCLVPVWWVEGIYYPPMAPVHPAWLFPLPLQLQRSHTKKAASTFCPGGHARYSVVCWQARNTEPFSNLSSNLIDHKLPFPQLLYVSSLFLSWKTPWANA